MSGPGSPFAAQFGEGRQVDTPTGDLAVVKADTARTNGSMSVLELLIAPFNGPARHTHLREDELWYVIEGEFRFKLGDAMFRVSTGGMAFGPRRVPHAFQNVGDTKGRLLVVTTPSGVERFFDQFADSPPGPVDPDRLSAIGEANWINFVGPPLGVSDPLD